MIPVFVFCTISLTGCGPSTGPAEFVPSDEQTAEEKAEAKKYEDEMANEDQRRQG